jgi:hypothetical protein
MGASWGGGDSESPISTGELEPDQMDHVGEKETAPPRLESGDEGDPVHTGAPSKGNLVNLLQSHPPWPYPPWSPPLP